MKIQRQNLSEEYSTTADWLSDFANGMTKSADYLSNLKSIMKKRNDFDTIDEKMADMKHRVGFDLMKTTQSESSENMKSASCGAGSCGTGSCGGCSKGEGGSRGSEAKAGKGESVKILREILGYIRDYSADRPEVGYGAVLTHCREHPNLGFDRMESKIDSTKFRAMVEKMLGSRGSNADKAMNEVKYIPEADVRSSYEDDAADYFQHAQLGT